MRVLFLLLILVGCTQKVIIEDVPEPKIIKEIKETKPADIKIEWLPKSLETINPVVDNLPLKEILFTYTVRLIPDRRDCLWRIAEYDHIYNDPWQWPRIYQANKSILSDNLENSQGYTRPEDIIYPGQILTIPR